MTMKKTMKSIFLILSLTVGMLVVSGCSNQDEEAAPIVNPQDNAEENDSIANTPLFMAAREVNENMAGLNFKELEPLRAAMTTRSDDNSALSAFQEKLNNLIDKLRGDITISLPYGQRFTYSSFNDVLDLSWEISGSIELGRESSTYFLGKHTNAKGQAIFTGSDGSLYTIDAEIDKDVDIRDWYINTNGRRNLIIYKGEELLLKIISAYEKDSPLWLPFITKNHSMTGEIIYRDYDIGLAYNKEGSHERKVDLSYAKVGSEKPLLTMTTMLYDNTDLFKLLTHDVNVQAEFTAKALEGLLTFNGKVRNINYLVVNSIQLSKCIKEGTTEENCNSMCNEFNANLTLSMQLAELDAGDIFMGPVYDEENNCYKPTLLINSEFMGFKNYPITQILESMGISLDDLMNSVTQ